MPARYETERHVIAASDVDTVRLVALAITLPVCDIGNFLFGRSHAYYAVAHTQRAALEFILLQPSSEQRRMASNALAMAGYMAEAIKSIPDE